MLSLTLFHYIPRCSSAEITLSMRISCLEFSSGLTRLAFRKISPEVPLAQRCNVDTAICELTMSTRQMYPQCIIFYTNQCHLLAEHSSKKHFGELTMDAISV